MLQQVLAATRGIDQELGLFGATIILIGGVSDIAIDLIWGLRALWRRITIYSVHPRADAPTLASPAAPGLDAYGQAGTVGHDGFVDGAVRVDRRIVRHGKSKIALGAGVWGGIRPGIARVDAGPQVIVRTPAAGGYLRASAEWRRRIAGNAQPASGPAVTLGMDF